MRPEANEEGVRPWARRIFGGTFFIPEAGEHACAREGRERLPIRELWGPSLSVELKRGRVLEVAKTTEQQAFAPRSRPKPGRMHTQIPASLVYSIRF